MRVMLFDRTDRRFRGLPFGLTHTWVVGGRLYEALNRFDAYHGVASWEEGLRWLADRPQLDEIQYWGHGNWGLARVGAEPLSSDSLSPGHEHYDQLLAVRERLTPKAQWWFRTCDTLGANRGREFAMRFSGWMGCPVAGHTHVIHVWQSGLHRLKPGTLPHWPATEGLREGTPEAPRRSTTSRPWAPNTLHMLQGAIPEGW